MERRITILLDMPQVVGMAIPSGLGTARRSGGSPWVSYLVTVLLRIVTLNAGSAAFLTLRALQGLAAGLTVRPLLAKALKVLPPPKRLPGLAAYALASTFSPNLAPSLAAL